MTRRMPGRRGRLAGAGLVLALLLGGCTAGDPAVERPSASPSPSASGSPEVVRPGECPELFAQVFADNYGVSAADPPQLPAESALPTDPAPSCVLSAEPAPVETAPGLSTRPWVVIWFGPDAEERARILLGIESDATARGYTAAQLDAGASGLTDGGAATQYSSPAAPDGTGWDIQVLTVPSDDGGGTSVVAIAAQTLRD